MNVIEELKEIEKILEPTPLWIFGWTGEVDNLEEGCAITTFGHGGVCDAIYWVGNDKFNERNRDFLRAVARLRNMLPRVIDVLESKP